MSINLRNNNIPQNLIFLNKGSLDIDTNYSHECSLYDKRMKQVPTSCTNPGTSVGSTVHNHGCDGSHTHTLCPTTWCHSHTVRTSIVLGGGQPPNGSALAGQHAHDFGTLAVCIALTICSAGCHSHGSACNEIPNTTVRTLKKTSSVVRLREGGIPHCTLLMWEDPLACIPDGYTRFTCLDDEYLKGVPNACAAPICQCTGSSHTHTCISHQHTITQAAHCAHTVNVTSGTPTVLAAITTGSGQCVATNTHTHTVSGTITSISGICGNVCSGSHSHTGTCLELAKLSVVYLSKSTIDMRRKNIPLKSISIWNSPLACIPSGHLMLL